MVVALSRKNYNFQKKNIQSVSSFIFLLLLVFFGQNDTSYYPVTKEEAIKCCLTFPADLSQVLALVVEYFDAVCPIVGYEYLLAVVDDDPVGELEVLGAAKLVQDLAQLIEDDDAHHLALDHDDATVAVHAHAARVLQDVGSELAHKLPVLVVNLDLQKTLEKQASVMLHFDNFHSKC